MASENDQTLSEFIGVTGVDEERARFFLQAANWQLHVALETFFESDSVDVIEQDTPPSELIIGEMGQKDHQPEKEKTSSSSRGGTRFATISQYQNKEINSSDDEGQAFYAGGSEHSGQQILGPSKKKKDTTQALFDAAKLHGAEPVVNSEQESSPNSSKRHVFKGAGFKLGSDVEPSQQVSASLTSQDKSSLTKPQNVVIKFWKNGFSVDSEPLRDFNDAANKDFLSSIGKGEVPEELRSQSRLGEVHVDMEDHRDEEYIKPTDALKAFSGTGHTLGSPAPSLVQEIPATTAPPNVFNLDESKPFTTIQIRLSNGTRLVTKFNHDNTIGDIRNVVQNARPNTGSFNLMTTFPNKVLSDNNMTIVDAKLLNAVIVQRMT